jgi:hypothetical protein
MTATNALEYGIMRCGVVEITFDNLDEARTALYRTTSPAGRQPRLVQRPVSALAGAWDPVTSMSTSLTAEPDTRESVSGQLSRGCTRGMAVMPMQHPNERHRGMVRVVVDRFDE